MIGPLNADNETGRYIIQLPAVPLYTEAHAFAQLRVGIVLHEIAHWGEAALTAERTARARPVLEDVARRARRTRDLGSGGRSG